MADKTVEEIKRECFDDIKRVFTVPKPAAFTREREAARPLFAAFTTAEKEFRSRPNPSTWARLVTASRRLHALKRKNDTPPGATPTKPTAPPKPLDPFSNDAPRKQAIRDRGTWLLGGKQR